MISQEASRRLTVQEAAEVLGTSVDAVRMRVRRGTLKSEKDADVRVHVWAYRDSLETKHKPKDETGTLISAKDETIVLLREQLEEERRAHSEARRLLAAALERIPPQLEAPSDERGSSESPGPSDTTTETEGPREPAGPRAWWQRWFGGGE